MGTTDYQRIAEAIRFLDQHATERPSLDQVARHLNLSPYHFQRLFRRWAGVSPKRYLQHLTVEAAKWHLRASASVLDTTYAVGLSSPGRLHDLFVSVEAVTPGEYRRRGEGVEIRYGFHQTPFGDSLLALSTRGVCELRFVEEGGRRGAEEQLSGDWRGARLLADPGAAGVVADRIFNHPCGARCDPLPVLLRGTNFQIKVWKALLAIPEGAIVSYSSLAEKLGAASATRAVASAVARNPIAYLIPCHRVLRRSGEIGGYRWDPVRKKAILARELAALGSLQ